MNPRLLPASFSVFTGALLALFATEARAACGDGPDCSQGFTCDVVGSSGCGYALPDPAPCPPDADCKVAPTEPVPMCDPSVIYGCVPAPCQLDADCAADMICYTRTEESCTSSGGAARPACDPASPDCADVAPPPPMEPPVCTQTQVSQCTPRYMLPCTTAADCGDGFECVATEECWCSGGGAVPTDPSVAPPPMTGSAGSGSSGAAAPLPGDPVLPSDCGCSAGPSRCQPQIVECEMNAECPTGWLCKDVGGDTDCAGAGVGGSAGTDNTDEPAPAGDPAPSAGGLPGAFVPPTEPVPLPPECTTQPSRRLCVPPYADVPYYGGSDEGGGTLGIGGRSSGDPGSAGGEQAPTDPTPPPVPGNDNGADDDGAESESSSGDSGDDGSCQMSHGNAGSSGASLLALVGLAAFARRRRGARV